MTSNPTIDGVSRELLERAAYRLSDLRQREISDQLFSVLSSQFACSFCDDKKSVCVDWEAGEWMSCPKCSPASDAPVVERQPDPIIGVLKANLADGVNPSFSGGDLKHMIRLLESPPEVATLQSTIAQLQARIAELESGRGEPIGWIDEPYAEWLKDKTSGWATVWGTDGTGNPSRRKPSVAVFTAPPAPVAVLWEIRIPDEPQNPESPAEYFYAQNEANRDLLLLRDGATVVAEYACLDATAALNGERE